MTRQKFIVGNWKMFSTAAAASQLARDVVSGVGAEKRIRVAVCPPATHLGLVGEVVRGTAVALDAQNVYPEKEGAYTGEIGINMLLDLGFGLSGCALLSISSVTGSAGLQFPWWRGSLSIQRHLEKIKQTVGDER